MSRQEMQRLFERHRAAEATHDYDAILATFVEDRFLETHPLGLRSDGRAATRTAYEGYFSAFPNLAPDDEGVAFGEDVMVVWGTLRGTSARRSQQRAGSDAKRPGLSRAEMCSMLMSDPAARRESLAAATLLRQPSPSRRAQSEKVLSSRS